MKNSLKIKAIGPYILCGSGNLLNFLQKNKKAVDDVLRQQGAVLLRNFKTKTAFEFQKSAEIICEELFDYTYQSSPRTSLGGKVYTSTEYPKDREIAQHNESSYSLSWPKKILFYCETEPTFQGETPIASSADVYQLIHPEIRKEFESKKVLYVRNYRVGMDVSWEKVFQTESKLVVEEYCRLNQIDLEWIDEDSLRTQQVCQATLIHPETKEHVWFNQAHLFHESANDPEIREYFSANFKANEMPRNTFFGDGSSISEDKLNHIREAYKKAEIVFPWKKNDLLILDNLRYSHGRRPFDGARKIIVVMGN